MQPTVLALEPRNLLSPVLFNPPMIGPATGSTISFTGTAGKIYVKEGGGNNDSVTIKSNAANIVVTVGDGSNDSVTIVDPNGNVTVNVGNGYNDLVTITSNGTVTVTTGSGSGKLHIMGTGTQHVNLGGSWIETP